MKISLSTNMGLFVFCHHRIALYVLYRICSVGEWVFPSGFSCTFSCIEKWYRNCSFSFENWKCAFKFLLQSAFHSTLVVCIWIVHSSWKFQVTKSAFKGECVLKHVACLPFVLGCTLYNILLLFLEEGVAIASDMSAAKIYHLVRVNLGMNKVPRISKSNALQSMFALQLCCI